MLQTDLVLITYKPLLWPHAVTLVYNRLMPWHCNSANYRLSPFCLD